MTLTQTQVIPLMRSQIYSLLAQAWRKPIAHHTHWIKHEMIPELKIRFNMLVDVERFQPLVTSLETALHPITSLELEAQYARLFEAHGGLAAPPYETEYTKLTPQHSFSQSYEMADIAGFYKAFGLEVAKDNPERVDHIVTELEFMHVLATKEAYAEQEGNREHLEIVQDAQEKFLNTHLGRWLKGFGDRLIEKDSSDYYHALCGLSQEWIALEQTAI